jgi:tetratricopeptide (TPR) repeat protein/tRNA A-37 threonylcarbamoyl transferase component Bud32
MSPGPEHVRPATVEDWSALEGAVGRFVDAWRRGTQPAIDDYLSIRDSLRHALLIELVQTDLELRLKAGEAARVEEYLARYPGLAGDRSATLDLIAAEYELRRRGEPDLALDEYVRRFPAYRGELTEPIARTTIVGGDTPWRPVVLRPSPPPEIDGYEILGELGRGGMGVVYKARQVRLNRVVALKMILAGDHASPEAGVRFLAEAEAVARLHHPHIVQIYSLGDHGGRPYFEMEYVAGGSLADQLDGTPRPARDAARLVETLARAIHEVHRLGIVHRDLKPANILLADDGTPKVADFGLAKSLGLDSGLTGSRAIIGSPSYMAPEQAAGAARDVGPATDVYSLGAILYELLTGRPPFLAETPLEMLEQVRAREPVPPSHLQSKVPRDLETIGLKCLRKEPSRRYASTEDLAEDLGRFLAGEPIRARPVGAPERIWRWCRRKPVLAGLAAALALALLGGLAGVATQWRRAEVHLAEVGRQGRLAEENVRRQLEANRALQESNRALQESNDRERAARDRGQRRFDVAMKALGNFEAIIKDADLQRYPHLEGLRGKLLHAALGFYRELQASLEEDATPESRSALSAAYARVAAISSELGLQDESLATHRRALALVEQMAAATPDAPAIRADRARCYMRIGHILRVMERPDEALRSFEQARELQDALARDDPTDPRLQENLTRTLANLGAVLQDLGRPADAVPLHRRAIGICEALAERHPGEDRRRASLAWCWRDLSLALASTGDPDAALRLDERAVAIYEDLIATGRGQAEYRWHLARCLEDIGGIHLRFARPADAADPLERAAGFYEALARDRLNRYRGDLVRARLSLASLRARTGQPEEALAGIDRIEELLDRFAAVRPGTLYDLACAYSLWSAAGRGGVGPTTAEREARAVRAVAALRRAVTAGYIDLDHMSRDADLDPLRSRPDFQGMMMDLAFPADPFAY